MTTELSKDLRCILLRADIELWLENDRIEKFVSVLKAQKQSTFVEIDNQVINTADVVGVFTAEKMEERTRTKNGQWKCKHNQWHEKKEVCEDGNYKFDENGKKIAKFTIGRGWEKLN